MAVQCRMGTGPPSSVMRGVGLTRINLVGPVEGQSPGLFQFAYVIAGAVQQLACLPQRRFVVERDVVGQWFGQVPVEAVRGDQRQPFRWVEFFNRRL